MLMSVLNICPDFVYKNTRTKKLLGVGTQGSCSTNKVTQKNCKGCFYVQILCFDVTKSFLYFVACEDNNNINNNNNNNNKNDNNNNTRQSGSKNSKPVKLCILHWNVLEVFSW